MKGKDILLFIYFILLFLLLDACVISEENMNKNNIQLKWKSNKRIYVKTGNIVEFACKSTFKAKTSVQSFQAICKEGKFEYPICE
jgi:hypothetical protein